jgi:hypothetical protein
MTSDRLAGLQLTDFTPHVGDGFQTDLDGIGVRLVLETALPLPKHQSRPRDPFALHFHGPLEPQLQQAIHRLTHPVLGDLEIFLVPTGLDARGVAYEAIFN